MLPTIDHLPELSSPIADVIVGDHVVSEESGDPRQSVPENRRSDMPDMHGLRNIRRAEVDDDGFRLSRPFHTQVLIQSNFVDTMSDKFRRKSEINETGPGDFRRRPDVVHR